MILIHTVVGVAAGEQFGHFWYILIGSVIADIDHIYILLKNQIFSPKKIIDTLRFEEKYGLTFKTPFAHSLFGAAVFSLPLVFLDTTGAMYFFAAYLGHLILDWPDLDEKQYFYPSKAKFRGFLPIGSRQEAIFTFCLIILLVIGFFIT